MSKETVTRTNGAEAWAAVQHRDRSWDGHLFYAVRTTGIYCRPSCPARRPKRENVAFFETAEAAETAGFRACHRCQPASSKGTTTEKRIRRALEYIEAHLDERITLEALGRTVGISPFHLQRAFTEAVGLSPRKYQDARRLEAMKSRLRSGEDVGRAAFGAGYGSTRGAYESARGGLGMTPGEYGAGAAGLTIRYSIHDSPFGRVLIGFTTRGICSVLLADSDQDLVDELRREFPGATLATDDSATSVWAAAVIGYLESSHPGLVVPVDLHGTTFQLRVWNALQEIPPGETRSYGQVAAAIGQPTAVRAVAGACASNRAALVVPCHRVLRSDGATGGYRWGERRKQALLEHERSPAGPESVRTARTRSAAGS